MCFASWIRKLFSLFGCDDDNFTELSATDAPAFSWVVIALQNSGGVTALVPGLVLVLLDVSCMFLRFKNTRCRTFEEMTPLHFGNEDAVTKL
jgi:hypothetical protein